MKSYYFTVLSIVLAIVGFIGGIINGEQAVHDFDVALMLTTWIETALFVLIFAGIGKILDYLEDLKDANSQMSETIKNDIVNDIKAKKEPTKDEWKCPKCGKINANYVGSCGCGTKKP